MTDLTKPNEPTPPNEPTLPNEPGQAAEPREEHAESASGWHGVNISHLVMSLAFLCLVGAWGLVQADIVTGDEIRWLMPIPWLVAGAAGLIAAAVSGARRHGVRR